jgi:hypothetical protein
MQTDLDDSEAVLPELSLPENQLCDIEISETDVEAVLSILNPSSHCLKPSQSHLKYLPTDLSRNRQM